MIGSLFGVTLLASIVRQASMDESNRPIILSLFDYSGTWSQPYVELGYTVLRVDLSHPLGHRRFHDEGYETLGVDMGAIDAMTKVVEAVGDRKVGVLLAAPPCDCFTKASAWLWQKMDTHGNAPEPLLGEDGGPLTLYQGNDASSIHTNPDGGSEYGIYLTPRSGYARMYGKNLHRTWAKLRRPKIVENKGEISPLNLTKKDVEKLVRQGFDGIISKNPGSPIWKASEVVLFSPDSLIPYGDLDAFSRAKQGYQEYAEIRRQGLPMEGSRTHRMLELVDVSRAMVGLFDPIYWAIENPPGRLWRKKGGGLRQDLGRPRLEFDPWYYHGWAPDDPRSQGTKRTYLWGSFNLPVKSERPGGSISSVAPGGGKVSDLMSQLGGRNKREREKTPLGFARAFASANQP